MILRKKDLPEIYDGNARKYIIKPNIQLSIDSLIKYGVMQKLFKEFLRYRFETTAY